MLTNLTVHDIALSPNQLTFIECLADTGFDVEVRHQYTDSCAVFIEAYEVVDRTDRWWLTPHHAAALIAANGRLKWMQGAQPLGWC